MSVVLERVAVGSWGCERWVAIRAAALNCFAVDSETAAVRSRTPSAGPGAPAVVARVDVNYPSAADNWVLNDDSRVGATSILGGVADNQLEPRDNGLTAAVIDSCARDNALGCIDNSAGPAEKGKADW